MSDEKRSFAQALKAYQHDQEVHKITGLMVQRSLNRIADIDLTKEPVSLNVIEVISQEDARKAHILEDILRTYMETYYPEFFATESEEEVKKENK